MKHLGVSRIRSPIPGEHKYPIRLLIVAIAASLVVEGLAMMVFWILPPFPRHFMILTDILITALGVVPVVAIGLLRPLSKEIKERKQAEEKLAKAHAAIETIVTERTRELVDTNQSLRREIQHREQVEAELIDKEEKLQLLLSHIPAIIWVTDAELCVHYAAGSGLALLQLKSSEPQVIDKNLTEVLRLDHPILQAHHKAVLGEKITFESDYLDHHFQVFIEPIQNQALEVIGTIGLAVDITVQKRTARQIRLQAAALEAAANGIVITDRQGRVEWANAAFSAITGYKSEEIIGKSISFLKSGMQTPDFYQDLWRSIEAGKVWQGEITNRRKDGSLYIEEQTITPVRNASGEITHFIGIKLDISTRKQSQNEIQRRNQELTQLVEISQLVSELLDPAAIITIAKDFLEKEKDIPNGLIYLLDDSGNSLQPEDQWGFSESIQAMGIAVANVDFPFPQVLHSKEVLLTDQVHKLPVFAAIEESLAQKKIHCCLIVPLLAQGQITGLFLLFGKSIDEFLPSDLHFYRILGHKFGTAIQKARYYEAEVRARRIAEAFHQTSLSLGKSLDVDKVLDILMESFGVLLVYDTVVLKLRIEGSQFKLQSVKGRLQANSGEIFPLDFNSPDNHLLQQFLSSHESILIEDTHQFFHLTYCPADTCVRSWIIVPLKMDTQLIGLVALGKVEPGFYQLEHLRTAEVLVYQAAIAFQNAWLFEQVRSGNERLKSLSHRLVELQEAERRYIALELHDEAGQALAASLLSLDILSRSANDPEAVKAGVAALRDLLVEVMENLHRVAMKLRPASLDHIGLDATIQQYVERFRQDYQLNVAYETFGIKERLPQQVEMSLYRIIQEALTNVVRHAQAKRVDIILENRVETLILLIEDDGIGFDPSKVVATEQLGLFGMRERAAMLGGELLIESRPGKGTLLKIEVPWNGSGAISTMNPEVRVDVT